MPSAITNPLDGIMLGIGANGAPLKIASGTGDPNVSTNDSSAGDLSTAAIGSLYLRQDTVDSTHQLYVKTAFVPGSPGTWTPK